MFEDDQSGRYGVSNGRMGVPGHYSNSPTVSSLSFVRSCSRS